MIGMAILVALVVFLLAATWAAQMRKTRDEWKEMAHRLGLRFEGSMAGSALRGTLDGCVVEIETHGSGEDAGTSLRVARAGFIPQGVALRAERPELVRIFTGEDIQTGDADFDRRVNVSGSELLSIAFLGKAARRAVTDLVTRGASVRDGELHLEVDTVDLETVVGRLRWLVSMALQFPKLGPAAEVLKANGETDPEPGVRLRNRRLLAERFRTPESGPELAAIVREILENPEVSGGVRAEAIGAARVSGDRSLVEPLLSSVHKHDAPCAEAVAEALGALGDERCEPVLLRLLERESEGVQRAAAEALARVGTIRAVEPLLNVKGAKAAARDAARAIQSRLGPVESGGLSVAPAEGVEGAVSVASTGGDLSLSAERKPVKG